MQDLISRKPLTRVRLAKVSGDALWQVVGVAAGVIGLAAQAGGFELEMRRAALRGGSSRD